MCNACKLNWKREEEKTHAFLPASVDHIFEKFICDSFGYNRINPFEMFVVT